MISDVFTWKRTRQAQLSAPLFESREQYLSHMLENGVSRQRVRSAAYVTDKDDFVAIQTYTRNLVGPEGDRKPAADVRKTQMGWELYPESLEHTICCTAAHCHKPIIITENGIATENDAERIEYTRKALEGMFRCIKDGIDVRGYYHWSAFDNYEWTEGYRPKFGLISVDQTSFARITKPSASFLGSIAKAGHL